MFKSCFWALCKVDQVLILTGRQPVLAKITQIKGLALWFTRNPPISAMQICNFVRLARGASNELPLLRNIENLQFKVMHFKCREIQTI